MAYNKIVLLGNICNEPDLKVVGKDKIPMCRFCVAVDRPTSDKDNVTTDFIYCTAWRETAKTVKKWFGKGRSILVDGELHIDAVEDEDGETKYYTTVNVNRVSFTGQPPMDDKATKSSKARTKGKSKRDDDDDEYPFG